MKRFDPFVCLVVLDKWKFIFPIIHFGFVCGFAIVYVPLNWDHVSSKQMNCLYIICFRKLNKINIFSIFFIACTWFEIEISKLLNCRLISFDFVSSVQANLPIDWCFDFRFLLWLQSILISVTEGNLLCYTIQLCANRQKKNWKIQHIAVFNFRSILFIFFDVFFIIFLPASNNDGTFLFCVVSGMASAVYVIPKWLLGISCGNCLRVLFLCHKLGLCDVGTSSSR